MTNKDIIRSLASRALEVAPRAHAPYSNQRDACVLLLEDGTLVPGVRVESASFSLVIPAGINALSTLAASGRSDVVAIAMNRPMTSAERSMLAETFAGHFSAGGDFGLIRRGAGRLPTISGWFDPTIARPDDGIAGAREIARHAVVPESDFPVACIAVTADGIAVPGVNVEHNDWSRVLCAERNALGTLVTYGIGPATRIFLTCLKDAACTPCGACRQLLAELAPEAEICMDRGSDAPVTTTPSDLLPGAFAGNAIPSRIDSSSL